MPQFVMEGRDHAARAESEIVLGYIEAMFFMNNGHIESAEWFNTDSDERVTDGNLPSDVGYSDIHLESLALIRAAVLQWHKENRAIVDSAAQCRGYDLTRVGHDLLYTSEGHGVGFWDRKELPEKLSIALTDAAKKFGEHYPFFGDHVTYGDAPFVHWH